jgi:glycosyl-4,4'-diaponeurosporenoate acyltransferase
MTVEVDGISAAGEPAGSPATDRRLAPMLVEWPWSVALAVDVVVWVVWGIGVGWWMAHRPVESLTGRGWLLRLRPFEQGGRWYERRCRVSAWKDRLPEAGTWFGGLSKAHLPPAAAGGLARYRAECVRAETTHWLALLPLVLFAIWTPWRLLVVLVVGGLACNLPCIVAPRYNRARIDAVLARQPHAGRA